MRKAKGMHPTAVLLNKIGAELKASFFEREDDIDAMLLALVSGQHMLMLGDPGTGKTFLVKALFSAIDDARKFEIALSKTKPAEKVLGPVDLLKLRQDGDYVHKRKGYATDVELAMFDEIGKMSPVTGHDLLALLANREYHEVTSEGSVHKAPLHMAFCPSNEIPTHESDEAAALYDRLLIRKVVEDIKDKRNFLSLLTCDVPFPTTHISFDDIKKVTEVELPQIGLSPEAGVAIVALRDKFNDADIRLSARRWRWSMDVLRAAAFLSGQSTIAEEHLFVLRHTLWDELEQIETVARLCASASNPFADELAQQVSLLNEVERGIRERAGDTPALRTFGSEATQKLTLVRRNLDTLLTDAAGRPIPGFPRAADRHRDLLIETFVKCMEQEPDIAELSAARRLGRGGGTDVEVS